MSASKSEFLNVLESRGFIHQASEPDALDADSIAALEAMGHTVNAGEGTWGNLQTVAWDKRANAMSGGTDPRNPAGSAEVLLESGDSP